MFNPLVNKKYLLEKFPGKGGWTYAVIPEIATNKENPFGWVKVKGEIDSYEFKNYHLMPMGNGHLFLPVKADIRKKIGKKEGDWVNVILYIDDAPTEIPVELLECLKEDTTAYMNFLKYSDGEKKAFVEWIYSAKKNETKVNRIAQTIEKLVNNKKLTDNT
jgi:hypothetical protein